MFMLWTSSLFSCFILYVCIWYVYTRLCLWSPEVDTGWLSQVVPSILFVTISLVKPEGHWFIRTRGTASSRDSPGCTLIVQIIGMHLASWLRCRESKFESTCLHSKHFTDSFSPVSFLFYFILFSKTGSHLDQADLKLAILVEDDLEFWTLLLTLPKPCALMPGLILLFFLIYFWSLKKTL